MVDDALWLELRKCWNNGDSGMASNDWNMNINWVLSAEGGDKLVGTDNVESGDTVDFVGVYALFFEDFAGDWNSRVDWVGNNADYGVWRGASAGTGQVGDDGGVCIEQVVTGHALKYFFWYFFY